VKKRKNSTAKKHASNHQRSKRPRPSASEPIALTGKALAPQGEGNLAIAQASPSEAECAALSSYMARRDTKAPMARTKVESRSGGLHLSFDHGSQLVGLAMVANVFGTGSSQFVTGLLGQLANAAKTGPEIKATELDFMLTVVRAIAPRDEIEALPATQMAAVHNAAMIAAGRLNQSKSANLADLIAQQDSASNTFNKLTRTFAAQLEALKRYRSGTEAPVKTQNVTVNDGGQAVVGNVNHGGDDEHKKRRTISSGQPGGAPAPGAALLGDLEEVAPTLPGASGEGQDGLPLPRRPRRRSKRLA
jgi:hypothetical protein